MGDESREVDPPGWTMVRVTRDRERAESWALVLAAEGIPFRLEHRREESGIVTPTWEAARASESLAAYDEENPAEKPPTPPPAPAWGRSWLGASLAWLFLAMYGIAGPADRGSPWFERGAADASRIMDGEYWRVVTALLLHGDLAHVLGNAAASVVFVTAVAWRVGPGVGLWLVLLSGILGNAATAMIYTSRHIAIGASTSTLGALGVLTALQLVDPAHARSRWRRTFLVVGASLALLGFLGTSEDSDLLAHLLGWVAGVPLGLTAALLWPEPLSSRPQTALVLAATTFMAACWWLAFL